MLTPADKKYINSAIDKSHKKFQVDAERYLGILSEQHTHEFLLVQELIETRPTRDEVREIVKEEIGGRMFVR